MKTIKFYDIPNYIPSLVFDGDKTDLRLHFDEMQSWGFDDEKEYSDQEEKINNFEIKGNGYTVYMWCDVSGFDYWIKNMEEPNYIQISISFDEADFKTIELDQLRMDLEKATEFAFELENEWYYKHLNLE